MAFMVTYNIKVRLSGSLWFTEFILLSSKYSIDLRFQTTSKNKGGSRRLDIYFLYVLYNSEMVD